MTDWLPLLADMAGSLAMAVLFVYYLQQRDQRQLAIDERKIDADGRLLARVEQLQQHCHDQHARSGREFAEAVAALHERAGRAAAEQSHAARGMVQALAELKGAVGVISAGFAKLDGGYALIGSKLDTLLHLAGGRDPKGGE